jgi:hypothetical protein
MNTAAKSDPRILALEVTDDALVAQLAEGRVISVRLAWSWRLASATRVQRTHFEILGTREGVHWPEIDEDISARLMLEGVPALPPKQVKGKRRRA